MASTTGDSNLGAREGSIRRVLLVRDRRSNESWGYGFAEFATVQVHNPPFTFSRFGTDSSPSIGRSSCYYPAEFV